MELNWGISVVMKTGKKVKVFLNKSYIFHFVEILFKWFLNIKKAPLIIKNQYLLLLLVRDLPGAAGGLQLPLSQQGVCLSKLNAQKLSF